MFFDRKQPVTVVRPRKSSVAVDGEMQLVLDLGKEGFGDWASLL